MSAHNHRGAVLLLLRQKYCLPHAAALKHPKSLVD
jgi:hypothetical protein